MIRFLLLAGLMMSAIKANAAQPSGASAVFTTNDPVVLKVLMLMQQGKFAEAQGLLAADDGHADAAVAATREEAKEIIARTKREYSQSAEALLAKLRSSIPDVTAADLEKWTKAGQAQHRVIDGKTMYFNREPSNIFRFCPEAIERRKAAGKAPKEDTRWKLEDHLKAIIAAGEKSETPEVVPVKHRIVYTLTIPANSPNVKKGSTVRVWLPFPQEYRQQKDVKLIKATPEPKTIAPNGIDGNPPSGAPQRTVYFEETASDPAKAMVFREEFTYTSYAYYPKLDDAKVQPLPADWNGAYLDERLPHIAFTDDLKRTVGQIVGDDPNALSRARKIFHWISQNIAYHAEAEYTINLGIAGQCFATRKGDCGVQSLLFITMCRIAGVPARWQSGWESKPIGYNMHDWAEFYVAPWGWLPADPSYGVQKSDDSKVADFYIGHQDSYRMIVNIDYGRELIPPKPSLRSEPLDFQRGEVEIDGTNIYFDGWDYKMQFHRDPGPNLEGISG